VSVPLTRLLGEPQPSTLLQRPHPPPAQIATLEDLNLAGTDVGAAGLSELAALPRLRSLDLSGSRRVDDAALAAVAGVAPLEALALRNTEAGGAGLAQLARLPALRSLDLGCRFELDDDGVAGLAGAPRAAERRFGAGHREATVA
jgi:hypothetical protein